MARGSKGKTLEEIAQQDDSDDEDYDNAAPGPSKSKPTRPRRGDKPLRKKTKSRRYKGSDIEDDEDDGGSDEDEDSFGEEDEEEEEVETNDKGRPVRRSAQESRFLRCRRFFRRGTNW